MCASSFPWVGFKEKASIQSRFAFTYRALVPIYIFTHNGVRCCIVVFQEVSKTFWVVWYGSYRKAKFWKVQHTGTNIKGYVRPSAVELIPEDEPCLSSKSSVPDVSEDENDEENSAWTVATPQLSFIKRATIKAMSSVMFSSDNFAVCTSKRAPKSALAPAM